MAIIAGLLIVLLCIRIDNSNLATQQKAIEDKLDAISDQLTLLNTELGRIAATQVVIMRTVEREAYAAEALLSSEKAAGEFRSLDTAINDYMAQIEQFAQDNTEQIEATGEGMGTVAAETEDESAEEVAQD